MRKVPELSLMSYLEGSKSDQVAFVDQLFNGIKDYGFIILVDHPLQQELIDRAYQKVADFFALSSDTKLRYQCAEGGGQRGYTSFGKEHAKNSDAPDLKEFWHVGREVADNHRFRPFYPKNIWPDDVVTGFQETLAEIYRQLDETSGHIQMP